MGIEVGDVFDGEGFDAAFQDFLVARQTGKPPPFVNAEDVAALVNGGLKSALRRNRGVVLGQALSKQ